MTSATKHADAPCIGLVGYGEVGRILSEDLRHQNIRVLAFDRKLNDALHAEALRVHAEAHGVALMPNAQAVAQESDLVISAVTASQAVTVAQACAPACADTWFLDFNSASPTAKCRAAEAIHAAGGRYVEGAVMTSVPPHRIRVPLILGGPHAPGLAELLTPLGFAPKVGSHQLGVASATKMCRSVMIKGMEAMVIESLTTARHYGVEDAVIASLIETFPGIDWERQAAYFFQRVIEHGRRRSEEVMEVAQTVRDAGLTPWSADSTWRRQGWMADLADTGVFGLKSSTNFARNEDWRVEADRILRQPAFPEPPHSEE